MKQEKTHYWQVFMSVAASMFGVQSDRNYRRDFEQESVTPYIFVGVLFVVGLIFFLIAIVNLLV